MSESIYRYIEKREFPWYQINDSSALLLSPDGKISYRLVDISKRGLGFIYIGEASIEPYISSKQVTVYNDGPGLLELPIRFVSDEEMLERECNNSLIPKFRRCGVQFIYKSLREEKLVERFLEQMQH